jgi:hypothetical protein
MGGTEHWITCACGWSGPVEQAWTYSDWRLMSRVRITEQSKSYVAAEKPNMKRDKSITREQLLEEALRNLLDYTVDVLTGPLVKGIIWPEGGPRRTCPILVAAQAALDCPREAE